MAGTIGIKIANGDFYPILSEEASTVKKLVLTTVHDKQASVQIDLYRSISKSMLDAQYIGSLVVENILSKPKGEPSIEMVISCDEDGNIAADARDLDSGVDGEHHTLNVSLQTLDKLSNNSPDYSLDTQEQTPTGLYNESKTKEEKRKTPWLIVGFVTLFIVIVLALLWFFFFGGKDSFASSKQNESSPAPVTQPEPVAETPPPLEPTPVPPPPPPPAPVEPVAPAKPVAPVEPAKPVASAEPVIIQAPVTPPPERPQTVQRVRPPAPVSSYKVPATIPKNGAPYQIRWGDTLWDISEAFYRNPWLYPRIARFNNISNPDLIIAGRTIRIPPRN